MREKLTFELLKIKKEFALLIKKQGKDRIVLYLYIIFSLAAVTIFGLFAIQPTLATISELHKEKDDGEFTLQQLRTKNQTLQRLSAELQQIESDTDLVYEAIPTAPEIPELIRKIEILSNTNNLALQSLSTGAIELYPTTRAGTQLFSFTFTVSVEGAENSINTFIQELINLDRIVSIERLNTGTAERGLFSANITGRAYFIKE